MASDRILGVSSVDDFNRILKEAGSKLVVVDFTATWCGPCRMISPVFEEQSKLPENANVVFVKVDVDEAPEVAQIYAIRSVPTILFFKSGETIAMCGGNPIILKQTLETHRT